MVLRGHCSRFVRAKHYSSPQLLIEVLLNVQYVLQLILIRRWGKIIVFWDSLYLYSYSLIRRKLVNDICSVIFPYIHTSYVLVSILRPHPIFYTCISILLARIHAFQSMWETLSRKCTALAMCACDIQKINQNNNAL